MPIAPHEVKRSVMLVVASRSHRILDFAGQAMTIPADIKERSWQAFSGRRSVMQSIGGQDPDIADAAMRTRARYPGVARAGWQEPRR